MGATHDNKRPACGALRQMLDIHELKAVDVRRCRRVDPRKEMESRELRER